MDPKRHNFLDRRLAYPGMSEASLQKRRSYWITSLGISCFVGMMFIPGIYYGVHSLILYGIMLLSIYVPIMILQLLFKFRRLWLIHLGHHLQLVVTFYIIVRLGGLHNCGGIILAGLSMVITSISFYSNRWALWYFAFYFLGLISVAVLQFTLELPAEMPSHVNHLFFLVNTIFLSAYTLVIVLVYLKQYSQAEKDKADRLRELDEVKTKLYTNITHEFRTPLTVILGMIDQIEEQPDKWLKKGLSKIRQNGQNLLHLVNQMLDLARLQAGAMPTMMIHGDVIRYLKVMAELFQSMANRHQLKLVFQSDIDSFTMDFDPEKMKRIFSNLLSNAIKYNHPGGSVTCHILTKPEEKHLLEIRVKDTGLGIQADRIEHVFDRFYRIEEGDHQRVGGSGLGLSITRELVHLLQGEITVESQENKGSEFTLRLPVTHTATESFDFEGPVKLVGYGTGSNEPDILAIQKEQKEDLPLLLMVEDNPDVADYLHSLLENDYAIESAANGQAGLKKALELVPDIILSDVMMPEMDGIEMLDQLKKDIRTSHIPVIMLTAKADIASRLEGFETGAEAYLEKPFNKEELFIRLRKLVELRKKLKERYANFTIPEASGNKQLRLEDQFMQRLHASFMENLEDENYGVDQICQVMAMSRAQLYRKFSALTNRTLMDYLLSFRLHRAMELLRTSEFNVTEVAYQVGFKNLSHFSSRFREEHGLKPSEVKQNKS